jgi:hypothetical protein
LNSKTVYLFGGQILPWSASLGKKIVQAAASIVGHDKAEVLLLIIENVYDRDNIRVAQ